MAPSTLLNYVTILTVYFYVENTNFELSTSTNIKTIKNIIFDTKIFCLNLKVKNINKKCFNYILKEIHNK